MAEHFLRTGRLAGTAPVPGTLGREVRHAGCRFDFRLDGHRCLEAKTPLNLLPQDVQGLRYGPHRRLSDTGRFRKHLGEMLDGLDEGEGATVLFAFQYDAEPFWEPEDSDRNEAVREMVLRALDSGRVVFRQLNMRMTPTSCPARVPMSFVRSCRPRRRQRGEEPSRHVVPRGDGVSVNRPWSPVMRASRRLGGGN